VFHVNPAAGFDPRLLFQQRKQLFEPALAKRRIHEHDIEWRPVSLGQIAFDVRTHHFAVVGFQQPEVVPQCSGQGWRVVHEGGLPGTPGKSLEPEGAGAGEQIEAVTAGKVEGKPVEQGFAGARGGGSNATGVRKAQFAAAPVAANDSQLTGAAAFASRSRLATGWGSRLVRPACGLSARHSRRSTEIFGSGYVPASYRKRLRSR
jgi:hypothetical protein